MRSHFTILTPWEFPEYLRRIVGFLFGFSLASSFAAYHLLEEFKQASAALQVSVEKLQLSTEAVRFFLPATSGETDKATITGHCTSQAN